MDQLTASSSDMIRAAAWLHSHPLGCAHKRHHGSLALAVVIAAVTGTSGLKVYLQMQNEPKERQNPFCVLASLKDTERP